MSRLIVTLRKLVRRLRRDSAGNILMMTGLAIIPLAFATGFGLDYSRAERSRTQLNAAADAAALAAVDPAMIDKSDSVAVAAATAVFNAQATGISGVTITNLTVTAPTVSSGSLGNLRTATVTYTASSSNVFSGILGRPSLPINGTSSAAATQPPSINFYLAMDTSPSMLLPITSAGIANLTAGAYWSGESAYYGRTDGCDFACHSNNMQQWNAGVFVRDSNNNSIYLNNSVGSTISFYRVSCSAAVSDNNNNLLGDHASTGGAASSCSGNSPPANPLSLKYLPTGKSNIAANYVTVSVNYPDTWWLAQNYALVNPGQSQVLLRTDAEGTAAQDVISYAYSLEQQYATATTPPLYKMQFYTFNVGTPAVLSTSPFGTMTDVTTSRSTSFPNMGANAPLLAANSYWTSMSTLTNNEDSDFTAMLNGMKAVMPTSAGVGTQASPQNVLMIITDGAEDDNTGDGITSLNTSNVAQCTAIKATGARIAILYTQYLPATINYTLHPTFNSFASNSSTGVPTIAAKLQACATQNPDGSYLMQTVTTDQDVSTALNTLFAMSVKTAHLVR